MSDKTKTMEELELERKQEEKDALLAKLKETGYKIEDSAEMKGIIKDMQTERKSRQEIEDRLLEMRDQNTVLAEKVNSINNKTDEDPLAGMSDDDLVSAKQVRDILSKSLKSIKGDEQKRDQNALRDKFFNSEQKAKTEFTADKMGEGLDYLSVMKGYQRMLKINPRYQDVMLSSSNPAAEAYKIGLMDSDIQAISSTAKGSKLLDNLNVGGGVPRGAGANNDRDTVADEDIEILLKMSDEQLMANIEKLESAK